MMFPMFRSEKIQKYFFAVCPEAPNLQMVSFTRPKSCPVCHCANIQIKKLIQSTEWEEMVAVSHS